MNEPVVKIEKRNRGLTLVTHEHSRGKKTYRQVTFVCYEGTVNGKNWVACKQALGYFLIDGCVEKDEKKAIRKAVSSEIERKIEQLSKDLNK